MAQVLGSHESLEWTGGLDCDLIIYDVIIKYHAHALIIKWQPAVTLSQRHWQLLVQPVLARIGDDALTTTLGNAASWLLHSLVFYFRLSA